MITIVTSCELGPSCRKARFSFMLHNITSYEKDCSRDISFLFFQCSSNFSKASESLHSSPSSCYLALEYGERRGIQQGVQYDVLVDWRAGDLGVLYQVRVCLYIRELKQGRRQPKMQLRVSAIIRTSSFLFDPLFSP